METFFIDDKYINEIIESSKNVDADYIERVLDKAEAFKGLSHKEVAVLLTTNNAQHLSRIYSIAGKIKKNIYGKRIVMFAPLYVSDYCINNCSYCGFKCTNNYDRKKLTMDEIRSEVKILEAMGHKRIALEAGEDPKNCSIDYILECLKTIYEMKTESGEIRRVNVNIAATTTDNYKALNDTGIGTYILFQETYHKETYEKVHISGPKSNYEYHTTAFHRAMEGGVEDVGAGALFGLYNPIYEVIGLMLHNEALEKQFGVGFHTISLPRIRPAMGQHIEEYEYAVDDNMFKKLVAILRIAVPFTGLIISTRETEGMRKELLNLGISQLSGGSSVEVGGYTLREKKGSQFAVSDERTANEIVYWLMDEGYIPSFCTACYRKGRTGDRFMSLAKSGEIKNVCLPNALITLKEYGLDYGDDNFNSKATEIIKTNIPDIKDERIRELLAKIMEDLSKGQRDLFL